MLGFLPILGPIIDGIFSSFNKYQDIKLAGIKDQSERIRLQHELAQKAQDDASLRLARDIIVYPVAIWCALGTWDTIMALNYRWLMFGIEKFPAGPLEYLPFAVMGLLFGNAWLNRR